MVFARRYIERGDDLAPFVPPATPIDRTVKIVSVSRPGFSNRHGTGFLIAAEGFGFTILTARHVLKAAGAPAERVTIHTTAGSCLGAAIAYPDDSSATSDCGVVLTIHSFAVSNPLHTAAPPGESFEAEVEGFTVGSSLRESTLLRDCQANGSLIRHRVVSPIWAGLSGGPIIHQANVVGQHVGQAQGLRLRFSHINACAHRANELLKEVFS